MRVAKKKKKKRKKDKNADAKLSESKRYLDKEVKGEYVHQKEPLKIPGCASVHVEDLFDPLLDRTNQQYDEYMCAGIRLRMRLNE